MLLAAGIFCGFTVSLLSWQINIIALHHGISRGRTAAFVTGAGSALADSLLMVAGLSGAQSILEHFHILTPMKIMGAVMILVMALKILFHQGGEVKDPTERRKGLTGSFLIGLAVVLGNPAMIFLWFLGSGMMLAHFPNLDSEIEIFFFAVSFFSGALLWFAVLSLVLLRKVETWSEKTLHILSRFSAAALLAALIFLFLK